MFDAIEKGNQPIVALILHQKSMTDYATDNENLYLPPGITPYQFAAWKNQLKILKTLYEFGHRLKVFFVKVD